MRLVVIGAPGVGKGTQAKLLAKHYDVPHVSTGDLLREHIENGDQIGRYAHEIIGKGGLVSDDVIFKLVESFIDTGNFMLDGFPRTINQARKLSDMLKDKGFGLDKVIYLKVPDDVIIGRMAGRETCTLCGAIYNRKYNPSQKDGICDLCGGKLKVREDDSEPVVRRRLDSYYLMTEPIIDYYSQTGLVCEIDGTGNINEIFDRIVLELNN